MVIFDCVLRTAFLSLNRNPMIGFNHGICSSRLICLAFLGHSSFVTEILDLVV